MNSLTCKDEQSSPDFGRGRSRTVTFRVSGREFESMIRASRSSGARSLSAFARSAIIEQIRTMQTPAITLSGDLTTLSRSLAQIDIALQEASRRIRRVLGSRDSERVDSAQADD